MFWSFDCFQENWQESSHRNHRVSELMQAAGQFVLTYTFLFIDGVNCFARENLHHRCFC